MENIGLYVFMIGLRIVQYVNTAIILCQSVAAQFAS